MIANHPSSKYDSYFANREIRLTTGKQKQCNPGTDNKSNDVNMRIALNSQKRELLPYDFILKKEHTPKNVLENKADDLNGNYLDSVAKFLREENFSKKLYRKIITRKYFSNKQFFIKTSTTKILNKL